MSIVNTGELMHYGVKGMKWGVRRYQNYDGTLTAAGRNRVSKQYKRMVQGTQKNFAKKRRKMYLDSYNSAADYMNREGISKFNAQQEKKYGKTYAKRTGYAEDYTKAFNQKLAECWNKSVNDFYKSDASYQKGKTLIEQYSMIDWDDLAKSNEENVQKIRRAVENL